VKRKGLFISQVWKFTSKSWALIDLGLLVRVLDGKSEQLQVKPGRERVGDGWHHFGDQSSPLINFGGTLPIRKP
jgi:hypothetical protein